MAGSCLRVVVLQGCAYPGPRPVQQHPLVGLRDVQSVADLSLGQPSTSRRVMTMRCIGGSPSIAASIRATPSADSRLAPASPPSAAAATPTPRPRRSDRRPRPERPPRPHAPRAMRTARCAARARRASWRGWRDAEQPRLQRRAPFEAVDALAARRATSPARRPRRPPASGRTYAPRAATAASTSARARRTPPHHRRADARAAPRPTCDQTVPVRVGFAAWKVDRGRRRRDEGLRRGARGHGALGAATSARPRRRAPTALVDQLADADRRSSGPADAVGIGDPVGRGLRDRHRAPFSVNVPLQGVPLRAAPHRAPRRPGLRRQRRDRRRARRGLRRRPPAGRPPPRDVHRRHRRRRRRS